MILLFELIPLITFFITFKLYGMVWATGILVVVSIISLVSYYFIKGKVSKKMIFSTSIIAILGIATVLTGDTFFIKIKPTILSGSIALALTYGVMNKKPYLKNVFGESIKMSENNWLIFSKRVAIYFFIMAIANEIVWRNFSEAFWINFKLFGFSGISLLFMMSQVPFMLKNTISIE